MKGEGIETKRALDGSNDIVVGATGGETLEQPEFAEVSRRQNFSKRSRGWVGIRNNTTLRYLCVLGQQAQELDWASGRVM